MNCAEAAECVSALFDGEPMPREAAAHLSDCEECRRRVNQYAEMGAELRCVASVAVPRIIPDGRWRLAEPAAAGNWLRKWRETMRIPRFAFALRSEERRVGKEFGSGLWSWLLSEYDTNIN